MMIDRLYDWWWRLDKIMVVMALAFLIVVGLVVGLVAAGLYYEVKQDNELRERYISLCVKDQLKENPYMDQAEALERCEVTYEMAKANRPKSDTHIIYFPAN
jgi:hypothetical protein